MDVPEAQKAQIMEEPAVQEVRDTGSAEAQDMDSLEEITAKAREDEAMRALRTIIHQNHIKSYRKCKQQMLGCMLGCHARNSILESPRRSQEITFHS